MRPHLALLHTAYALCHILRSYDSLSEKQREQAETPAGLPPEVMDEAQRRRFRELSLIGLPRMAPAGERRVAAGLYVTRAADSPRGESITFRVVAGDALRRTYPYRLSW